MVENILIQTQTYRVYAHNRKILTENTNFVHAHNGRLTSCGFVFFGASGGTNLEWLRSAIAAYIFSADVFLLNDVCYALPFLRCKNARPGIRAPNECHIL